MLVITRRVGESFYIGDNVKVTILDETRNQTRIGIEAPLDVNIVREELLNESKKATTA